MSILRETALRATLGQDPFALSPYAKGKINRLPGGFHHTEQ